MPQDDPLLAAWEENYKKGLLTLWVLLVLHERQAYPFEMADIVGELSRGTIVADPNSLYRALSRFERMGIVASSLQESDTGPARRYYRLTARGTELLRAFLERNILLFQTPPIARRIKAVVAGDGSGKETR
ncbi:MAG: helix-turn-helix transcriptional regulator [Chloroflexi bacterium]|nr:helix-turn-helix transcriptional regulator [Chloroflexota bacterium]